MGNLCTERTEHLHSLSVKKCHVSTNYFSLYQDSQHDILVSCPITALTFTQASHHTHGTITIQPWFHVSSIPSLTDIYIMEMPGVNLSQHTSYPHCFPWFFQYLKKMSGWNLDQAMTVSFWILSNSLVLPFDAISTYCEILTASQNRPQNGLIIYDNMI